MSIDINIASNHYHMKPFNKHDKKYWDSIFSSYVYDDLNPKSSVNIFNNIDCPDIKVQVEKSKRTSHPYWGRIKVLTYYGKVIRNKTLLYEPISQNFVKYWEIIKNNFSINYKKILDISSEFGVTEVINYMHVYYNFTINTNTFLFLKYINVPNQNEMINLYKRIDPSFNEIALNKYPTINEYLKKINGKYDLIFVTPTYYDPKIGYYWEQQSFQSTITYMIFAMLSLNVGGEMCIRFNEIKMKLTLDCVYILTLCFESVTFYDFEIRNNGFDFDVIVICKNFRGLHNQDEYLEIINHLYEYDKTGGKNFNILDEDDRKNGFVTKPITDESKYLLIDQIFPDTIHNNKAYKKLIDQVRKYNAKLYKSSDGNKKTESNTKYAKKYDLVLKTNELSLDRKIDYIYEQSSQDEQIFENKVKFINMVLDTRNVDIYSIYRGNIKFTKQLESMIDNKYFSQAGIKLYEILEICKVIPSKTIALNTFHLCELPGSFLYSLDLYLNTKTRVKEWKWIGQSLKEGLEDTYKLVKRFPNNWNFADGTGDITKNVEYYTNLKALKDAQLITSDCGLSLIEGEKKKDVLFLSSISIILNGSSVGSSYIQKIYLPLNEELMTIINDATSMYKESYIYKPTINQQSRECYLIFKNKLRRASIGKKTFSHAINKVNESYIENIKDVITLTDIGYDYVKNDVIIDETMASELKKRRQQMAIQWIQMFNLKKSKKTFL